MSALIKQVLIAYAAEIKLVHLISEYRHAYHSLESLHLFGLLTHNLHYLVNDGLFEGQLLLCKYLVLRIFFLEGLQSSLIALFLLSYKFFGFARESFVEVPFGPGVHQRLLRRLSIVTGECVSFIYSFRG